MRIYACPLNGNSYTESLYATARHMGLDIQEGIWSGRWLLTHLGAGDILHLHWPSFFYYDPASRWRSLVGLCRFVLICLLLRLRGARIVWTAHNLYPHDGAKREWMHRFARWVVVRIAHRIFVHGATASAIVRDEFQVDPGKLRVVQHGHWIGTYPNTIGRAESRLRLGLSESAHVFLFIGLCKPYKGLEALMGAIASLEPGAVLVIAGKFPSKAYQATITALAEQVGTQIVSIRPGFVAESELQIFLNAADTVVLPYREILTSGVAMLAMSFGRPVIAPRLGSLIDVINEGCGILYDSNEPSALREALRAARSAHFSEDVILATAQACSWEDNARALAQAHGCLEEHVDVVAVTRRPETE